MFNKMAGDFNIPAYQLVLAKTNADLLLAYKAAGASSPLGVVSKFELMAKIVIDQLIRAEGLTTALPYSSGGGLILTSYYLPKLVHPHVPPIEANTLPHNQIEKSSGGSPPPPAVGSCNEGVCDGSNSPKLDQAKIDKLNELLNSKEYQQETLENKAGMLGTTLRVLGISIMEAEKLVAGELATIGKGVVEFGKTLKILGQWSWQQYEQASPTTAQEIETYLAHVEEKIAEIAEKAGVELSAAGQYVMDKIPDVFKEECNKLEQELAKRWEWWTEHTTPEGRKALEYITPVAAGKALSGIKKLLTV
jgi:hypothetical protein